MNETIVFPTIKKHVTETASLQQLTNRNEKFKVKFRDNLLFKLIATDQINSVEKRTRFLSYFQIWSDNFQKAMLLKTALCDDNKFMATFQKHYAEEYGHDEMLIKDRQLEENKEDAILEAICNWFPSKMLSFNHFEQIVVMNLCVEASAVVFYEYVKPAIDPYNELKHFQAHEKIDCEHEKMGLDLLEGLTTNIYQRLLVIQEKAWAMLEALMQRLGELTIVELKK